MEKHYLQQIIGQLSDAAALRLSNAKLQRHKSARDLYLHFLKPMMEHVKETDPNQLFMGDLSAGEIIKNIEDIGFWGFAHTKTGTIHCWWTRKTPKEQLIAFVCHELEHVVAQCRPKKGEEKRCDLTAAIGVRAIQLLGKQKR